MTIDDLWIPVAKGVFGFRFRDAWSVAGWEEGCVVGCFVCLLPTKPEAPINPTAPQLKLFG